MRVAVNVEQLLYRSPGGIGRYTAQLAAHQGRHGEGGGERSPVVPFTARHPHPAVRAALGSAGIGAPAVVLPLPRPALYEAWHAGSGWLGPGRLSRELAAVDVVHAPSAATPPHERAALVVSIHDAAPYLFPEAFPRRGLRFHRRGLAAARRRADLVLTGTHVAAEEVSRYVGITPDRIRVVPYGVDPRPPAPSVAAALLAARGLAGRPYVLWVGSLEPRKNVGTLVAAMARLHAAGATDAALVLAGYAGWLTDGLVDGEDRRRLGGALVQTGPVTEDELWALYGAATLAALPSVHEGYGYPAVEAMACGVPVVVSDLPVLREVTGAAAATVAATDVGGWARTLGDLLDDGGERRRMAAAGRSVAAGRTVAACIDRTWEAYREVSGATRRSK